MKPKNRQKSAGQSPIQKDPAENAYSTLREPLAEGGFSGRKGWCPVPKRVLLLVAGLVWFAAGANVLKIGVSSTEQGWHLREIIVAMVVFSLFMAMFARIVHKNKLRIMGFCGEKAGILCFFDNKGYVMMVLMMGLGNGLRYAQVVPLSWIQTFYSGLGTALAIAGMMLIYECIKAKAGSVRNPA